MPSPFSSSRSLTRLISGRGRAFELGNEVGLSRKHREFERELGRYAQSRFLGSLAGFKGPCIGDLVNSKKMLGSSVGDLSRMSDVQKRWFLGVGDGEEGDGVSKTHEERRVMGYSPEQLFAVVAAVDLYEDFLPWCTRSRVIRRHSDGSFDAELEIGFKFLVESYVSHVQLQKPKYIKTTASESELFDHLINIWEFNPGPVPGTCDLHFFVDFKFQSPLYGQVVSLFFKEVVSKLVNSFSDRCQRIYGPGVQVLETPHGQGT